MVLLDILAPRAIREKRVPLDILVYRVALVQGVRMVKTDLLVYKDYRVKEAKMDYKEQLALRVTLGYKGFRVL